MTAATESPCPAWCGSRPGHGSAEPGWRLHEMHVAEVEIGVGYSDTAAVSIEAEEQDGVAKPAHIRLTSKDAIMTHEQATKLGAYLLLAAGQLSKLAEIAGAGTVGVAGLLNGARELRGAK